MILFTTDLLFGSKILGAAKYAGLRGQGVRNRASLAQHAPGATHFFLDLEAELAEGESPAELLDAALGHPHLRVFAFAGHLQTERLRDAQRRLSEAGGAHEVHSRGSLHQRLAEILPPVAGERA
ncbi:MAG: hypothetical protein RL136_285 [Planctomycetota bacterium]